MKKEFKKEIKEETKKEEVKKRSWLKLFTLDNMISIFSLSFIASLIFILAHNWLSAVFGEMSLAAGAPFILALVALTVNTIASLYLVWHGLVRLVRKR